MCFAAGTLRSRRVLGARGQTVYTLKCNITAEVNHLNDGMKIALLEDREKNSLALGRSALWKGESKVAKLPPALNVQFVRFFWKTNVSAADGTQGTVSARA